MRYILASEAFIAVTMMSAVIAIAMTSDMRIIIAAAVIVFASVVASLYMLLLLGDRTRERMKRRRSRKDTAKGAVNQNLINDSKWSDIVDM